METARIRENRSSGGVGQLFIDPDTARHIREAGSTRNVVLDDPKVRSVTRMKSLV